MDNEQDRFTLSVTIPAEDLAQLRRRLLYLEATLIQVLRDERRVKEWFSAAELVALRLPGLPTARAALTRLARSDGWKMNAVSCQGGQRHEYHFSSLPRRAFDALIDLVVAPQVGAKPVDRVAEVPELPAADPPARQPQNTAPPWVLPLMRSIRQHGAANLSEAIRDLPAFLPEGVTCPTVGEAMEVLRALGMAAG